MKKIGSYAENGYIQGKNLIMTFESSEKVLNTKEIDLIMYRPQKVRPKNLTIGGRYFYG